MMTKMDSVPCTQCFKKCENIAMVLQQRDFLTRLIDFIKELVQDQTKECIPCENCSKQLICQHFISTVFQLIQSDLRKNYFDTKSKESKKLPFRKRRFSRSFSKELSESTHKSNETFKTDDFPKKCKPDPQEINGHHQDYLTYSPINLTNYSYIPPKKTETSVALNEETTISTLSSDFHEPLKCTEKIECNRKHDFTCQFCNKQFVHKGDFNKHLRIHTKEQPFSCNVCNLRFAHTSNLHRHLRIHSGLKPFICEKCGKAFNRNDKLQSHQKSRNCKSKSAKNQQLS